MASGARWQGNAAWNASSCALFICLTAALTTLAPDAACLHCARPVDGAAQCFCPQCGQPTPPHRIDWHFLGHELEHSLLHMDRGLLHTLRELMLRPGRFLRGYLAGHRVGHAKPLLLITVTAAAVVLIQKAVVFLHPEATQAASLMPVATGAPPESVAWGTWVQSHYALATVVLLPLQAACFRLAFGRGYGLNLPEWLVTSAFLTAQAFVLQSLGLMLTALAPRLLGGAHGIAMIVAIAYSCASLVSLFRPRPAWRVVVRSLWGYTVFIATAVSLSAAGAIAWRLLKPAAVVSAATG